MFQRVWYRIRHHGLQTSTKVYLGILAGIIVFTGVMVYASGAIKRNSFKKLYSKDACLAEKLKFDADAAPRKSPSEIEDPDLLIPVRFQNNDKGNGKWGFIDAEGNVIIEGTFDEEKRFYGGYVEIRTEDWKFYYLTPSLEAVAGKDAAPKYVEGRNIDKNWQTTKTSLSRMMIPPYEYDAETVASLEEASGLQVDYINRFSLPFPYYTVRYHSFEYDTVYGYFDENFRQVGNQVFFRELYVDRAGVTKADTGCGYSYLNERGETIWMEDYEQPEE